MPIYVVCPKCLNEYNYKKGVCPKCGYKPKKGEKLSFRVSVNVNGKRYRTTVNCTIGVAKQIEIKTKDEVLSSVYFNRRQQTKKDISLNDFFFKKYMPFLEDKSKDRKEQLYRIYISPVIDKKKIRDISPFDVEKVKKQMLELGRKPRTIEYALAVLRHVLNRAKILGYYSGDNPVSRVKVKKTDNRRVRFLTKEEAERLLEELKKRSQQTYEIAYLSLYTGMRAGEIFNLKWSDIDFTNGVIYIKDPKSGKNRVAYITEGIRELLSEKFKQDKPKADELVFKSRTGGKIERISKAFERAVNKLGLNDNITDKRDKVVFHTLRHTFASWLVMQGTPIYTVKELMGHKTLAMTERYSHLAPDTKREAVEKLTKKEN